MLKALDDRVKSCHAYVFSGNAIVFNCTTLSEQEKMTMMDRIVGAKSNMTAQYSPLKIERF